MAPDQDDPVVASVLTGRRPEPEPQLICTQRRVGAVQPKRQVEIGSVAAVNCLPVRVTRPNRRERTGKVSRHARCRQHSGG